MRYLSYADVAALCEVVLCSDETSLCPNTLWQTTSAIIKTVEPSRETWDNIRTEGDRPQVVQLVFHLLCISSLTEWDVLPFRAGERSWIDRPQDHSRE